LAEGKDPSAERKETRERTLTLSRNTFGLIAREFIDKLETEAKATPTLAKKRWMLLDLARDLSDRPITEITAAEILALLKDVERSGRRETARRLRGTIGQIFRYAIATLRVTTDPTYALRGALAQPVVAHRAAILDEKKLGALMLSIDEYTGWATVKAALQFLALTMARPGEVRFMRKSEVNFMRATWSIIRNILGQTSSPKFDLAYSMNNRRIFIANLAKGQIGEQASNLLGSLLMSHLQFVAMARSDQAPKERMPFFVHVDEFQSFSTEAFAPLLSEARKFATHFCIANQYLDQVNPAVRAAVLGNAGTLMVFRVSSNDAALLAPEFDPLPAPELADQSPFRAWLKRMDSDHRAIYLEAPLYPSRRRRNAVIAQSRRNFARRQQHHRLHRRPGVRRRQSRAHRQRGGGVGELPARHVRLPQRQRAEERRAAQRLG
jgi:integrase